MGTIFETRLMIGVGGLNRRQFRTVSCAFMERRITKYFLQFAIQNKQDIL